VGKLKSAAYRRFSRKEARRMKKQFPLRSSLRWFLLLWVGMAAAAWLVGNLFLGNFMGTASLTPGKQVAVRPPLPLSLMLLFLLLVALYSFLLWMGLSDRIQPRFFWWYFLGQGLLVFTL
jgi:two-component system, NarL family, sensor histidine kinase YdfH